MSLVFPMWLSFLIGSILVPAFVAYFTGDAFVKYGELRREHNSKIVYSMQELMDGREKYYPLGIRLNNRNVFVPVLAHRFVDLEYSEYLLDHLLDGYPDVHKLLMDYETLRKRVIEKKTLVMEHIRDSFHTYAELNGITQYYYQRGISGPPFYIQPKKCAESGWFEINHRYDGFEKFHQKPEISAHGIEGKRWTHNFHSIQTAILDTIEKKNAYQKFFEDFFDDLTLVTWTQSYREVLHIYEQKGEELFPQLQKIVEKNDLNGDLLGECDTCHKVLPKILVSKMGKYSF